MYNTSLSTNPIKCGQLGWTNSPVATRLPGYNMEMVVRHFLAAVDAVVLESEYSQRLIGTDQREGQSPGGTDDLFRLVVTEIQQCWGMPFGNDAALSGLILIRIDDRDSMFAFFY